MNNKKGKFIVLVGGEGSGKSTAIDHLKQIYPDAIFTREPGGTEYAEKVREIMLGPLGRDSGALSQMLMTFAASNQHLREVISPGLRMGKNVFSDRICTVCSWAYQIFGEDAPHLRDMFDRLRTETHITARPDLVLFFDVEPEEGARRVARRKGKPNHYDERALGFHYRIRDGYRAYGERYPEGFVRIDAMQDQESMVKDALAEIKKLIN